MGFARSTVVRAVENFIEGAHHASGCAGVAQGFFQGALGPRLGCSVQFEHECVAVDDAQLVGAVPFI